MSKQKITVENPEEETWIKVEHPVYQDDEGKFEDDPRTGIGSKYYKEKHAITFAQSYLKTPMAKAMDDNNKKAMKVWANKGTDAAINYMMHQAGGDYGRMRSMYG